MNPSDVAAWVGAATGSLALLWDIVTWLRSGPQVVISVNPDMVPVDPTPDFPAEPHLLVKVRNRGDAPTTLTTLAFVYYPTLIARLQRRGQPGIILKPTPERLPRALNPGEEWNSLVMRGSPIEDARVRGKLVCTVYHTMSNRPARHTVRFTKSSRDSKK